VPALGPLATARAPIPHEVNLSACTVNHSRV